MIYQLSSAGAHHRELDEKNQDVLCYGIHGDYTVITLADGVSTCMEARKGAEVASKSVTDVLLEKSDYFMEYDGRDTAQLVFLYILRELRKTAKSEGKDVEEYSSTVASVMFDRDRKKLWYFNLGDGIIIGAEKNKCRILSRPGDSTDGCHVTTTWNATAVTDSGVMDLNQMESVVICSDGAWRHMFQQTRIKPEVISWLVNCDYEHLEEYLIGQDCFDDFSFIAMNLA